MLETEGIQMRLANNKLMFEFKAMFSKSRGVLMMKLQLETSILEKKKRSSSNSRVPKHGQHQFHLRAC